MNSLFAAAALLFLPLAAAGSDVSEVLGAVVDDPFEVSALLAVVDQRALRLTRDLGEPDLAEAYRSNVVGNLEAKAALKPPLTLSAETLQHTVLDYEDFKLRTYVSAGVFPKRYFGYFDLRYDTAEAEIVLRDTTMCAVQIINAYQEEKGRDIRINDAEVAVTFISEGGAILLREQQQWMNRLHPIMDVGLDDISKGQAAYPGLVATLDEACGTKMVELVQYTPAGGPPPPGAISRADIRGREYEKWGWFTREMTFKEGIVATAFMWLWEKEIAQRKLIAAGSPPLHTRDVTDQFIIGSLVYNSGIVHSASTHRAIRSFTTGAYLYKRSEANAHRRQRLNVPPPDDLQAEIAGTFAYREQYTSWVAVYHIMQRYGGWKALHLYTDVFADDGSFRPVSG